MRICENVMSAMRIKIKENTNTQLIKRISYENITAKVMKKKPASFVSPESRYIKLSRSI